MIGIVLLIVIVLAVIFVIGMYNSLVQLRVRADSSWSDIDVQLKRRHDLIPNLVETVKGYATHEKGTFENIAKFRSQAMQATSPADKAVVGKSAYGRAEELVRCGRKLPGVESVGAVHPVAGCSQPDRGLDPELATLLQRGRS